MRTRRGRSTWIGAGAAACLLVAGCFGIGGGGEPPATHYYGLRPPAEAEAGERGAAAAAAGIGVETFDVDPPYDQDRLVYRPSPESTEVGFYHYHRWAAPLGRLTAVALAEGLAGGEGLDAEPWTSAGDYAAMLGGRVVRLEEVDTAAGPEVRIEVELRLRRPGSDPFWTATLGARASGAAASGGEIMRLVQRAFDELVSEARPAVAAALAGAR